MAAHEEAFVQVSDDGLHFQVASKPFFFAGANCYYLLVRSAAGRHALAEELASRLSLGGCAPLTARVLQTRGADPNLQHEVTEVLDAVQQAGLTVVRTWAFCDGDEWNALQPSPGMADHHGEGGLLQKIEGKTLVAVCGSSATGRAACINCTWGLGTSSGA